MRVDDELETLTQIYNGTFELRGLARRRVRLTVSVVGYILVQRVADLTREDALDLRIPLVAGPVPTPRPSR